MKKTLLATTAFALVALAMAANAQNYVQAGDTEQSMKVGQITSATTLSPTAINIGGDDISVLVSASAANISATVQKLDRKGNVLESVDLGSNGTGYVSKTYLDPFNFAQLRISPTGPMSGSQKLFVEIVQPRHHD